MRLVFIIPGTGRIYSGACARELTLAQGLAARGHDVRVVPLHTPLKFDQPAPEAECVPAGGPPAGAAALADLPPDYPTGLGIFTWKDAANQVDRDPDHIQYPVHENIHEHEDAHPPEDALKTRAYDYRAMIAPMASAMAEAGMTGNGTAPEYDESATGHTPGEFDDPVDVPCTIFHPPAQARTQPDAANPANPAQPARMASAPDADADGGVDVDVGVDADTQGAPRAPRADEVTRVSFNTPEAAAANPWPTIAPDPTARPREGPLFFGGLNTRLQYWLPAAAGLPAVVRRGFDRFSAGDAPLARPDAARSRSRGRLAVAMLAGEDGPLRRETNRLVDYLANLDPAPDVVVFGGALLSSPARELRERLPGAKLVCMAEGADLFIERLREPNRSRVRRLVRKNARLFDRVLTTGPVGNARAMGLMALPAAKMRTVRPAIDGWRFGPLGKRPRNPFTIGYLSNIEPDKGLDRLAEAFQLLVLKKNRDARLWIAGRVVDAPFWRKVQRGLKRAGLTDWVTVFGELDFAGKRDFLRNLSVFSVPSRLPETRGTVFLEAMAAGVPVAAPNIGVLPELMKRTVGGVLLPPDSSTQLAEAFALMMDDPATADNLGRWGRARVLRHYSIDVAAEECECRLAELLGGD